MSKTVAQQQLGRQSGFANGHEARVELLPNQQHPGRQSGFANGHVACVELLHEHTLCPHIIIEETAFKFSNLFLL